LARKHISLPGPGRSPSRWRPLAAIAVGLLALALIVIPVATAPAAGPTLSVANLQVDSLTAPLGITDTTPTLSWSLTGGSSNDVQATYQIQAASSLASLNSGTGLLWDSGVVSSAAEDAVYAGTPLGSRSQVFWRVRVSDSAGTSSAWSQSTFEIGLTKPSDWTASWITDPHWTGASAGVSASSSAPITISFAPVQARYIRLNITKLGLQPAGDSHYYAQLAEMQVFGPAAPQTDLALGKSVTTSDSLEGWGWGAAYLTDGVDDTQNPNARGWSTNGTTAADVSSAPVWATIDLGSVQSVSSVSLWPRTDYLTSAGTTTSFPVNYSIETSATTNQTASFSVASTVTGQPVPPTPTPPTTITFPAVTARYIKLNITQLGLPPGGSTYYAQLAEIGVYGPNTPGDLALGKTVTSSDSIENWGWFESDLTDGVTDTQNASAHGWSTNGTSSANITSDPAWVTIDLGSVQTVSSVRLWKRTDVLSSAGTTASFPVNYTIQTSTTNTSFKVAATVTGQADPPVTTTTPAALPLLAKQFTTTGTIAKARLFVTGIGIVVPSINGTNVGNEVLQPGDSNLADRLGYSEYDVTSMLNSNGANAIGLALGLGDRYVQPTSPAQGNRYVKYSSTPTTGLPRALAQLEITYTNGTTQTIATDGTWSSTLGPTTVTAWYGGESYDAQREIAGWNQPGTNLSGWSAAAVTTAPFATTQLVGQSDPPTEVVAQRTGTDMGSPASGVELYNFGVNAAGWEQFTITAPKGTTLTFTPGEILQNGRVEQDDGNIGTPVYDTFTSNGGTETWHPSFDYHGFQYMEVSGITAGVTVSNPTMLIIRAANSSAGTFTTSNTTINAIHALVDRAVQSNMMSILTDCPSREKLGWDEEVQLLFPMIARNYDVDAYGRTLVQNMADAQLPDGLVPDIAPEATVFSGGFRDDVNWGSSMIMVPWELYLTYGDVATLSQYYSNMAAYLAYLNTKATGNLVVYGSNGLGDWGESSVTSVSTPVDLVENWGYYRDEQAMANIATVLGKTADASAYSAQAAATLAAFTAKWFNPTTDTVANGTQSSMAMALDIGAVPAAAVATVTKALVASVSANGLAVGEIGLTPLFRVLSESGNDQLLYNAVTANKIGGYGYFVAQGQTSLPEYWNITSGSHNHFMLGGVDLWLNSDLVGISQAAGSVGFQHLVIKPSIVGGLTSASGSLQTNYGQVTASWSSTATAVTLSVGVPVGSTATVYVPVIGTNDPVTPAGATYVGMSGSYAEYTVGSGNWTFAPAA
jgi:alpha-L-rhamnosidase